MAFDRNEGFAVVQRVLATTHVLLVCLPNNDFELFVIPFKMDAYGATENDVINLAIAITIVGGSQEIVTEESALGVIICPSFIPPHDSPIHPSLVHIPGRHAELNHNRVFSGSVDVEQRRLL